jgi:alanine racemase
MRDPLRCWVEVSRSQLAANFRAIRDAVGPGVEVMPVVKADAYRHGAIEVSKVLMEEGARWLAVSSVEEGVSLRRHGVFARILVMGGVLPWERHAVLEYQLTPVVHSLEELRLIGPVAYHLKIDTGMGRLGVCDPPEAIIEAIRQAHPARLEGLMTHFASSADFTSAQTGEQTRRFFQLRDLLAAQGIRPGFLHMSSTNPVMLARRETWLNMVRPGISVYGYWTQGKGDAPKPLVDVRPVLDWKASVVLVKDVPAGAQIGYGGMYRADRPMRIAVMGAGYADGLPHRLSNKGRVIAKGRFAPILGAVSMDLTTIDVTAVPELQAGDSVSIIGAEGDASQDARHLARAAGAISYSILCGISARVRRVYL